MNVLNLSGVSIFIFFRVFPCERTLHSELTLSHLLKEMWKTSTLAFRNFLLNPVEVTGVLVLAY